MGESHLNLLNTLSCDVGVLLSSTEDGGGRIGDRHDIAERMNAIVEKLQPGRQYSVEVRVSEGCRQVSQFTKTISVKTTAGRVDGILIRSVVGTKGDDLEIVQLKYEDEPEKANGGNCRVRSVGMFKGRN